MLNSNSGAIGFLPCDGDVSSIVKNTGRQWKEAGITTSVIIGRFSPFHAGHAAFFEAVIAMGLDFHAVLNANVNTANGKNPYNVYQKMEMIRLALPQIPEERLHPLKFYLGLGGVDVGADRDKLISKIEGIAPRDKVVVCYIRKEDDIKDFLVHGKVVHGHYVDLLPFAKQILLPHADFSELNATSVRDGTAPENALHPRVKKYLEWEAAKAELNGRRIGDDHREDTRFIARPDGLPIVHSRIRSYDFG